MAMAKLYGVIQGSSSIEGKIQSLHTLRGNIRQHRALSGKVSSHGSLIGMMNPSTHVDGHRNNKLKLQGLMSAPHYLQGYVAASMAYSDLEEYDGAYDITPLAIMQRLSTKHKKMKDDMTIHATPYSEVSNDYGGYTVTIL